MKRTNPEMVEAAMLLHEQLLGNALRRESVYLPNYGWDCIQKLQRQIQMARARGWHAALKRLHEDLSEALSDFRRQLDMPIQQLQTTSRFPRRKATATDIYCDLLALEQEFEDYRLDVDEKKLSITTDIIELEETYLGPFQIRLEWSQVGESHAEYRVIALDPHPARKNEAVTHPHVQDECLCEGEGRAAIAAALVEGRLYDFFLLISQILHTYGRGSAYVELENWYGDPCTDCGDCVDPEDRYCCQSCDSVLCASCAYSCEGCHETYCSECIGTCSDCDSKTCNSCLNDCKECARSVCGGCRETSGLCTCCHEKQEKEDENDETEVDLQPEPVAALA
jgi:hypothetical protein